MKRYEKVIMARDPNRFIRDVNEDLAKGWEVKPGTWAVQSITKLPNERTPPHVILPSGVAIDSVYFVSLISPPEQQSA